MVLFKKQTGSAFPVFLFYSAVIVSFLFFCQIPGSYRLQHFFYFHKLTTGSPLYMSNCSVRFCQDGKSNKRLSFFPCERFHFTTQAHSVLLLSSMTHHFTFINLTHQSCQLYHGRMQEVVFFFFLLKLAMRWTTSGRILAPG